MSSPVNRRPGLLGIWGRMGLILSCVLLVSFGLTKFMSRMGDAVLLTIDRQERSVSPNSSAGTACGSCHRPVAPSPGTTGY